MSIQNFQAEINAICQIIAEADGGVSQIAVEKLLNIIERLAGENDALKNELQKLSDEINRLKGEKGKPDIKRHLRNSSLELIYFCGEAQKVAGVRPPKR